MPEVVSQGRKPNVAACGYCHLPNGLGRPENESVAGLSVAYMMEQMEDFKNGLRKGSEPHMASVEHMIGVAKAATPEEMKAGAEYFAAMKLTPWIRVVETATVAKTRIAGGMLVLAEAGGREPIGERVIEVPENLEQTELRNSKSGFVAYVPVGSLKRGEMLVKTGGSGGTMACTLCHGQDLRGVGNVPSIAGRSPSQMTRQIVDFQRGSRNGAGAQLMKAPVAQLTIGDIVAITGYLASQRP
jgi:cytochrome c553